MGEDDLHLVNFYGSLSNEEIIDLLSRASIHAVAFFK
jgi:hypothetical protein